MFEKYSTDLDNNYERSTEPVKGALVLQILNVLAWLAALIMTIVCTSGAIRYSIGTVWDLFPTRLTPANYVVVIWFILFFFCILFLIYQVLPRQRNNLVLFRSIHFLSPLAACWYIGWIVCYHHQNFWVAAAFITVLVITLIVLYLRTGIGWKKATPPLEYWCVHLFWSTLLAWMACLCFETWSKAARYEEDYIGGRWNQQGWAILWLEVLAFLTLLTLVLQRDWAFGLTVAWYMIAVGADQENWRRVMIAAFITGGVLALLSLLAALVKLWLWMRERKKGEHPPAEHVTTTTRPVAGGMPAAAAATGSPAGGIPGSTMMPGVTVMSRNVEPAYSTGAGTMPTAMGAPVMDDRAQYRRDQQHVVP